MTDEIRIDPGDWEPAIAATDGPQLVVAGPGAGKTEFLVRRALHLVDMVGVRPDELLVLSFSRRTVADLRARLSAGLDRSLTGVPAVTFHSLAMRLIEAHPPAGWTRLPTLLTGPEQVSLITEILADEAPSAWPLSFRGMLDSPAFAEEVTDFVLRCREHLVDADEIERRAAARDDWDGLSGFLRRYDRTLRARNRIDYGTLQSAAIEVLGYPGVAESVSQRFGHVLVDEYQDTTVTQASLLAALTRHHRNLTVAGDPYQSIYSFRGASVDNIARFPDEFRGGDGRPARRIVLTTSFRVPAEILEAAVRVTAGGRLPGAAGPVVPAAGRGSVEARRFDQQTHEAEWIAAEVERMHRRDRIPYASMAVLVRSKRRLLPELSRALARRGIAHDEPDRRLVDHPAVRIVFDIARASMADGADRTRAIRRLMLGPLVALPLGAWRDLEQEAASGTSWPQVLRAAGHGGIADAVQDSGWASGRPAADAFWHLWSTVDAFAPLALADRTMRGAWSSFSQVLGRLKDRDPEVTLASYVHWSEADDFEATPLLEFGTTTSDRLTLTTLHQAKGRAFDVVIIADAVDGVFPDLRRRETLLQVRHLASHQPRDAGAWAAFRLQEEMRLAYTAMCRSARRVVWTCTSVGDETGTGTPSRFIDMITGGADDATIETRPPVTPIEAEAWLQRIARDPAAGDARRLAAISLLAVPADWRVRDPGSIAGILPRGPDTGIVDDDLVLSPSQAEAYHGCPRRYVLERRLLVDDGGSIHAEFGSLVHAVLEAVEREALTEGRDHATLDEALEELDQQWAPGLFGGGVWAASWHARAVGVLENLFGNWPGRGAAVAVEARVEASRGGLRWVGKIDRLEHTADGVTIVDYKTSRSPVSVAEAATSLQLGFYALATEQPVVGAEFWYPAKLLRSGIARRTLDTDRLDEIEAALDAAAEGIIGEDWTPRPSAACERCRVKWVCPVWPQGQEAFTR